MRPGFPETVKAARDAGGEVRIVSAGLDFYVLPVLERQGFGHLSVLAVATSVGSSRAVPIRYDYPSGQEDCEGDWGICKCLAVNSALRDGNKVVFVGDGLRSDACAARRASKVFARRLLLEHCRETGMPVEAFDEDLFPVAAYLKKRTSC
jgi:2-hydroxy-3-keto-5-methylthiopentenyl-1-phosphate phosphatase